MNWLGDKLITTLHIEKYKLYYRRRGNRCIPAKPSSRLNDF